MANFKTHLTGASAITGMVTLGFLEAGLASSKEVLLYFSLGALGGILPDIDSDYSIPTKLLFSSLAIVFSFLGMFSQAESYSIAELAVMWLLIYVSVRYLAYYLFIKLTIHRGIIHSVPAGILFWFMVTTVSYRLFHLTEFESWAAGFFLFLGYLVHLILDEIYSVDLSNMQMKKSFGSALKLFSLQNLKSTFFIYALIIAMYFMTPSPETFFHAVWNSDFYHSIRGKFLPEGKWFRNLWDLLPASVRSRTS